MPNNNFCAQDLDSLQKILGIKLPEEAHVQVIVSPYQELGDTSASRPLATDRLFITRTKGGIALKSVDKTRAGLVAAADQP